VFDFFTLDASRGTFRLKKPLPEYPFSGGNDNIIQVILFALKGHYLLM
jgi:hypothetical protein